MLNRSSRTVLLAAALSAALISLPFAQAADEPAKGVEKPKTDSVRPDAAEGRARPEPGAILSRIEESLKGLDLSEEQKTKSAELVSKVKKSLEEAKDEGRQGLGKALSELKDGLNGLLSEEQMKSIEQKLPMLNRAGGEPGPGGRLGQQRPGADRPGLAGGTTRPALGGAGAGAGAPGQRGAMLLRAQQAAMEKLTLSDEQKAKIKSLNEEMEKKTRAVLEEIKGDRSAAAEKLRPMLEERRKKLSEILSAEQFEKFQESMKDQLSKLRGEAGPATRPAR